MNPKFFMPIRLFIFLNLSVILLEFSSCLDQESFNSSLIVGSGQAIGTWYGPPNGDGSDGGACGYGHDIALPPYNSMIAAGSPSIYQGGAGCGTCYQVKCKDAPCSGNPVTITLTDECPGCSGIHFDLSGTAFGAMSKPGQADALRNIGKIQLYYLRVPCDYHRTPITFKVDRSSTPYYFSCAVEYEWGDGDIALLELQASGSNTWLPMQRVSGANWKININGATTKAPFSIRLTQVESRKRVIAYNVIPYNWVPGGYYKSNV